MRIELESIDAVGLRAANPGPLTLSGTNTWVVGSGEVWVIDPGPSLEDHVDAVAAEVGRRGRLAGIALTHGHSDHSEAVDAIRREFGEVELVSAPGGARHGDIRGPLEVIALPGHSSDHLGFIHRSVAFTGDALFAESSVFISPGRGSLSGYLDALGSLAGIGLVAIAPGHGPLIVDPDRRIEAQIAHRLERERRLVEAIEAGRTTVEGLLATVWDDVPEVLLPAATVTLAAHLDKLEEEGRLPSRVERPEIPEWAV